MHEMDVEEMRKAEEAVRAEHEDEVATAYEGFITNFTLLVQQYEKHHEINRQTLEECIKHGKTLF